MRFYQNLKNKYYQSNRDEKSASRAANILSWIWKISSIFSSVLMKKVYLSRKKWIKPWIFNVRHSVIVYIGGTLWLGGCSVEFAFLTTIGRTPIDKVPQNVTVGSVETFEKAIQWKSFRLFWLQWSFPENEPLFKSLNMVDGWLRYFSLKGSIDFLLFYRCQAENSHGILKTLNFVQKSLFNIPCKNSLIRKMWSKSEVNWKNQKFLNTKCDHKEFPGKTRSA